MAAGPTSPHLTNTGEAIAGFIPSRTISKLATATVLTGVGLLGYEAQRRGLTYDMPEAPKLVVDSFKHPIVGYMGAWLGSIAARKKGTNVELGTMVAFATVANFGAETSQSLITESEKYEDFLSASNIGETIKDYVFALGGCCLLAWQRKMDKITSTP